jgi:hypothetical protein
LKRVVYDAISDEKICIEKLENEAIRSNCMHEEVIRQIEIDTDKEFIELRVEHEKSQRELREQLEQQHGQLQSAKKRIVGYINSIASFEFYFKKGKIIIPQTKKSR